MRLHLHLLEVVEQDQAATASGNGMAQLHRWIILAQRHRESGGHGEEDPIQASGFGQIAEVDAPRPISQPRPAIAAHQARLATAA